MRIYISVDMEGITGLASWSQCSRPAGPVYDFSFARRMMTHDVNAAIQGARRAGASEIVVKDSHGIMKNLLIEDLEPRVELVSGTGFGMTDGMMQGIGDGPFDAAILVGYHAKAGTHKGVMEHTYTTGVHRVFLGDREVGEMGFSVGAAAQYGVPTVAVTSDQAGVNEALDLIPGIATAITKSAFGRYSGRLKHPSETFSLIEAAVFDGIQRRAELPRLTFPTPLPLRVEFNTSEEADMVEHYPGLTRRDGYTVEGVYDTFAAAHAAFVTFIDLSIHALRSQQLT